MIIKLSEVLDSVQRHIYEKFKNASTEIVQKMFRVTKIRKNDTKNIKQWTKWYINYSS